MAKNGKQKAEEQASITLSIDDRRWYENLVMKEQLIKRQAQDGLQRIAVEAEDMMRQLSEREGVDLKQYAINWQTGEAVPPPKEASPS